MPIPSQKATDRLHVEIYDYDRYLCDECYGYRIFDYQEELDSCWGFLGNYKDAVDAMKDAVSEEYRHLFDEEQTEEWGV